MNNHAATTRAEAKRATLSIAARRHPLVREVDRQLARCGLTFSAGAVCPARLEKVIVGVSGGADSVALLLTCIALRRRTRRLSMLFEPVVVHVHHHLRDAADADADWVMLLCGRFGVECHIEHVHPAFERGNTYANARRLRYAAMTKVAGEIGAKHVLVAHHAEDQLETVLMAMCRGAGPRGLTGMRMSRAMGGLTLLRPLLHVRKHDCEEMCRKADIEWREDASNKDVSRRRARLRRDVLPVLEELWPDAAKRASMNGVLLESLLHKQSRFKRRADGS